MLLIISKVILTTEEVITATLFTSSVDKIIFFVAKFTLVVAEMTFKVVVNASLVAKITFVVTEIDFRGWHKIVSGQVTFVATEITFQVAVITSSVAKITL